MFVTAIALSWWNYGMITASHNSNIVVKHRALVTVQATGRGREEVESDLTSVVESSGESEESEQEENREDVLSSSEQQLDSLFIQAEEKEKEEEGERSQLTHDVAVVVDNQEDVDNQDDDDDDDNNGVGNLISGSSAAVQKIKVGQVDLIDYLESLEEKTAWWRHQSHGKRVLFWGSELFNKWYFRTWSRAFKKSGFTVDRRVTFGQLPKAGVEKLRDYAAAFCLTYEIGGCFGTKGMHRHLPNHIKLNMAPLLRETVWNKGNFCKIIRSATQGNPIFDDYIFNCFIHPQHTASARKYAAAHPDRKFIIKPLASGGGKGIRVVDDLDSIKTNKPLIIQNFLHNPHLIERDGPGRGFFKWDLRAYAVVTSTAPLRAYVYPHGLVRFAAEAFDRNAKNGGKPSTYLTNLSLGTKWQKKDVGEITWPFSRLKDHMTKVYGDGGAAYNKLMKNILGAASIMFLSAEQEWRRLYKARGDGCPHCFKHFGLDIIIDENLNARVIEANGQPGMALSKNHSDHYSQTKINMMQDLIGMVYNGRSSKDQLATALTACNATLFESLSETEWQYLMEYLSERENTHGWMPVYPNEDLANIHTVLLEQQAQQSKSRLALHKILLCLEGRGDLADNVASSSTTTTTSLT